MKFYSIKYLETKGIEEFEGEVHHGNGGYAVGERVSRFEALGKDAFTVRGDAVVAGRGKLAKTIESLKKREGRLEKLLKELR